MQRRHHASLILISVANTAAMLACGPTLAARAADCAERFTLEQAAKAAGVQGANRQPGSMPAPQRDSHEPRTILASFDCPKNVKPLGGDSIEVLPCLAVASPTPPVPRTVRWVGVIPGASPSRHSHDLTGFWALAPPTIISSRVA